MKQIDAAIRTVVYGSIIAAASVAAFLFFVVAAFFWTQQHYDTIVACGAVGGLFGGAAFVEEFGLLQRGYRHIDTWLDERRGHRLTWDLFEPAGNGQRQCANLDGIANLRVKLQNGWRHPRFIATVPGKGYRFLPVSSEPPPDS